MKNLKIIMAITLLCLLGLFKDTFAQTQSFDAGIIPQTIISSPISSCVKTSQYAFYEGQFAYFNNTFGANVTDFFRIMHSQTDPATSSKVLVYNPFGAVSTTEISQGVNSFVPNFVLTSTIKPKNVSAVYVSRQYTPTYFLGGAGSTRTGIAAQVTHNIWVRAPYTVRENGATNYAYMEYPSGKKGSYSLDLTFQDKDGYRRTDKGYLCNNIYVARCGDGVIDNPNGTGGDDGKKGISTSAGLLSWWSSAFNAELCDDGALNGTPGYCDNNCGRGGSGMVCGNFIIEPENDEVCDEGDPANGGLNGSDLCELTCTIPAVDSPVDEAVIE